MSPDSAVIERGIEAICLEVVEGHEEQKGKKYELGSSEVINLGRGVESTLQVFDVSASRKHAVLEKEFLGPVYLRDNESRNGTYVNGERIDGKFAMQSGDIIKIGNTELKYTYTPRSQ